MTTPIGLAHLRFKSGFSQSPAEGHMCHRAVGVRLCRFEEQAKSVAAFAAELSSPCMTFGIEGLAWLSQIDAGESQALKAYV